MSNLRISEDIVTVSEFKAQAPELLKRVGKSGQPLVITQNGKAAAVLLSPAEFDRLTERARGSTAIDKELADAQAASVGDHAAVVTELKPRARSRTSGR